MGVMGTTHALQRREIRIDELSQQSETIQRPLQQSAPRESLCTKFWQRTGQILGRFMCCNKKKVTPLPPAPSAKSALELSPGISLYLETFEDLESPKIISLEMISEIPGAVPQRMIVAEVPDNSFDYEIIEKP